MKNPLEIYFNESIEFLNQNRDPIIGKVYIGNTEIDPVATLKSDNIAYGEEFQSWLNNEWGPEKKRCRNVILDKYGNKKRYDDLCGYLARGQLVPFVGSGMSAPSGLPLWAGLLRGLREKTSIPGRKFDKLLKEYKYEEAALALATALHYRLFNEQLEHLLRQHDNVEVKGSVRLLPSLFPGLVITTNLDQLLEIHYAKLEIPFNTILSGKNVANYRKTRDGKSLLIKLHGDCKSADGRVLLPDEYNAAYATGSTIREELALIYHNNSLLFLGCSLGPDRTINLIEEVAAKDSNMPKHYAFLKCPADNRERIKTEQRLTKSGIFPIWYADDHDESITCLLAGLIEYQSTLPTNGRGR